MHIPKSIPTNGVVTSPAEAAEACQRTGLADLSIGQMLHLRLK